jgi:vacuolar iron transporter family protein
MKPVDDIARFRANLIDELNGAALYNALAEAEPNANRRDIFLQLAEAEARHARFWRDKLTAAGVVDVPFSPTLRTRLIGALARRFGPRFVLPTVAAAEFNDRGKYLSQPDALTISAEERGHAAVVEAIAGPARRASTLGSDIGRAEPWHRNASGNNLRAAVLGANDGLVSNFCLVMGVAGAGASTRTILLTGVAEAEEHELALILQAKGVSKAEAQRAAAQIMKDPAAALDTLAREELGIDPTELGGNPWTAAATSFALFATGAIFPVLPYLWNSSSASIVVSAALSAFVLAGIGMLTSLFNGRSVSYSALRQVAFGCLAAAVTFGVGRLLGVSLA